MAKGVIYLLDVKIAHFFVHRDAILAVFGEVIPAVVAVAEYDVHAAQLPADFIGQVGLGDELLEAALRKAGVKVEGGERVAVFCTDQAIFDLEFQDGLADLAKKLAIPADAGFHPLADAADVGVVVVHIGGVEVEVVDMAGRVGGVEDAWVALDEHPHLGIVEVFDTEFTLVAVFSDFGF